MASSAEFMEYVCGQISGAGEITYKKMFGEYSVYCNGKIIALVCDNQFFVKITPQGESFLHGGIKEPPYPGAKLYFLIDNLDDCSRLARLVRLTHDALPAPKKKTK